MQNDEFDHLDVLTCLKKGTAHGPEFERNEWRTNVLHAGLSIRVVVGPVGATKQEWDQLSKLTVISVMKAK